MSCLHHTCCRSYPPKTASELHKPGGRETSAQAGSSETRRPYGIGYVPPNDEHTGHGETIRAARLKGRARHDPSALPTTAGTETMNEGQPPVQAPMWSDQQA